MPYEFGRYEAAAEQMYAALWETTPHVLGVSCDEAYLECSALLEDDGDGDGGGGGRTPWPHPAPFPIAPPDPISRSGIPLTSI